MLSESPAPSRRVAPRAAETYGDLAADLSASYDLTPDDWQRDILDDWLAFKRGRWASLKCGLSVPRQNGKNGVLEVRELFGMVGRGEKILHTAHQVKTAQKHFRRLKHFFGKKVNDPGAKFPELNALVSELRNVNGQEAIFLHNGASVEIVARSDGSGRGFTVDVIVCDEAQDMSDDDLEALLSTSSAGPLGDPQWIFTGTPPGPKASGEVFTRVRDDALTGKAKKVCWHEWSAGEDDDLDDVETWARANPGLAAGRLLLDVVEGERSTMSEDGFKRERLGMWSTVTKLSIVPLELWERQLMVDPSMPQELTLAIQSNLKGTTVSGAGVLPDGRVLTMCRETLPGVGWVPAFIEERVRLSDVTAVVIDAGAPNASLIIDELTKRKIAVTTPKVVEITDAASQYVSGIEDGWLVHGGQPQLTQSLMGSRKRQVKNTGAWTFAAVDESTGDDTQVRSSALAVWGVRSSSVKKPKRKSGGGKVTVL